MVTPTLYLEECTSVSLFIPIDIAATNLGSCVCPQLQEFPFYTLRSYPNGFIKSLAGMVTAHSVKLLDEINNPGMHISSLSFINPSVLISVHTIIFQYLSVLPNSQMNQRPEMHGGVRYAARSRHIFVRWVATL